MTQYGIAYRMRVYQPRSQNLAETAILAPIAGAIHSDSFQVATIAGVSGYQPYMEAPSGRRGRLDPLTGRTDTGSLTVGLIDHRTTAGGTNLERWVTAFVGGDDGEVQLLGLRAQVDESIDAGTTWTAYYTGRISSVSMSDRVTMSVTLRDARDDLKVKTFVSTPHTSVTYAATSQLWPVGSPVDFGVIQGAGTLTGDVADFTGFRIPFPDTVTAYKSVVLDDASVDHWRNVVTADALGAVSSYAARLELDDASTIGHYQVRYDTGILRGTPSKVKRFSIAELSVGDPFYKALPTSGTAVSVRLLPIELSPSKNLPLVIQDVHPVTLIESLLNGHFGHIYTVEHGLKGVRPSASSTGDPFRSFPMQTGAGADANVSPGFTAMKADASFPLARFLIDKTWDLLEFIEQQLCVPYGIGYRINASGEFEVLDLRFSDNQVVSPATLDDTDIDIGRGINWEASRDNAVNVIGVKFYRDQVDDIEAVVKNWGLNSGVILPAIPASTITSVVNERLTVVGSLNMGEKRINIDAQAFRFTNDEIDSANTANSKETSVVAQIEERTQAIRLAYGAGVQEVTLPCRRTTDVTTCLPGDWRIIDVDVLPDTGTNKRGGARLMRCLESSLDASGVPTLRMQDAGPNVVLVAPTVGTLAAGTVAPEHVIRAPITVNASTDPVEVHIAITDTATGTIPVEGSALWVYRLTAYSTFTYDLVNIPSGKRCWVRARSIPGFLADIQLPSAWAFSTGTDYFDTTALAAPTGPAVLPTSILTTSTVSLSWTNASFTSGYTYPIELLLHDGAIETVVRGDDAYLNGLATPALAPGSAAYTLNPHLVSSTTYTARVRYADIMGGQGTKATSGTFITPAAFAGPSLAAPTLTLT